MRFEPRIGPDGRDDDLTRGLRQLYAAPADEGYWRSLAERIMARVANELELEAWWQPLAAWARIGVIAAGIALAMASVALSRSRADEARIAYETIIETPRTAPLQLATEDARSSGREVTLRLLIAP